MPLGPNLRRPIFGVTRERIRQIENNTLKKLETLPEAQSLRGTMG